MLLESKIIGILGGGQLGRMSALAAARLGFRVHIYCPEKDCPASQVTDLFTCAAYEDTSALEAFARQVDVITYEFENIPLETVRFLQKFKPVYPDDRLLEVSQDRLKEKKFLNDIGIPTAPWAPCTQADDIRKTLAEWNMSECIVKTARFGYDGKGQVYHKANSYIEETWSKLNTQSAVIEGIVDFACEVSVIVGRDRLGQTAAYPAVLNEHRNHILSKTHAPAPISKKLAIKASDMAHNLAEAVDLIGVMALELFVTQDEQILANEIAPRTHNSGHWTIDACAVSQFEQHIRTVSGLPVGMPDMHKPATMINLIGDDVKDLPRYLEMPNACVHLYGKHDVKPGRKMGHVTLLNR
jgi:5-(carboxyamino)imidazole ribonucleotide synthase